MVYLDILIGFSLVMLVFASAVSVAQTVVKRLFAIKGNAIARPLLEEVERAWGQSPQLIALGADGWKKMRGSINTSMTSRRRGLGKALRRVAVRDGNTLLRMLRDEGLRNLDSMDERQRAAWDSLVVKLGLRWESLSRRLSATYEDHTRRWVFALAAVAVVVFNVDAIRILRVLSVSRETRTELAELAKKHGTANIGKDPDSLPLPATLSDWQKENFAELASTGLPLGWEKAPLSICAYVENGIEWNEPRMYGAPCSHERDSRLSLNYSIWLWLVRLLGLLVGAGLIAQGAPFWYSVLDSALGLKKRVSESTADNPDSTLVQPPVEKVIEMVAAAPGESQQYQLPPR